MSNLCIQCGSVYEITDEDLQFYEKVSPMIGDKKYSIPPPKLCPPCRQQRHYDRMELHNAYQVFDGECDKCGKSFESIYEKGVKHQIYCEECYLKGLY